MSTPGRLAPDARHAAITGLGAVTSIGTTLDEIAVALREGRSGVVADDERRRLGFRSPLTGRIPDFDPRATGLSRRALRTMGEPAQYAHAAARAALADASLDPDGLPAERSGVVFGNDSTVAPAVEAIDIARSSGETHFIGGGHIFRTMNSTVSMNLATLLGVQGANWTVSAACASSAHALGQAALLIRSGLQDVVVAGGAQEMNWESMASFDALGVFSTRADDPEGASRPFDADRDGLVPSGGAACLILEDLEHARARGACIYAVLRGYGFSSDGSPHLTQPEPRGARRAIGMALHDAQVSADAVDYINAHATSTVLGDRAEAAAIAELFGSGVPVSSTKSMTGHECWMAGASELLYTVLMGRHGFLAPNLNFTRFDDDTPAIHVLTETVACDLGVALSNSFGFGGTNAAIVLDFGPSTR